MTTVTQGSTASATLTESDVITLSATGGNQGRVSIMSAAGLQKYSTIFSDTRTVGPFLSGDVLSITSMRGSVDYTITPYTAPTQGGGGGNSSTATMSALGSWNLTTNVATAPDGVTTFVPANGVYPTSGANFLVCIGTGSQTLDTQTYSPGDFAVMSPALGAWERVAGSSGTIAATTKPLIGDGAGSAVAGASNVDFAPPSALSIGTHLVLMPAGTVGANGALTITGTALVAGLTEFYGYYPANSLTGANAAGFYWTSMSSTTAGTVYNNTYTPGTNLPAIPSAPTAFSATTGAAYTNTTGSNIVMAQVALGNNPLGKNGFVRQRGNMVFNTGATAHNIQTRLNGSAAGIQASASSTNIGYSFVDTIQNCGRTDRQAAPNSQIGDVYGPGAAGPQFASIDTSGAVTWSLAATLGATSDWVCLLGVDVAAYFAA
jgi:hypothetical protein